MSEVNDSQTVVRRLGELDSLWLKAAGGEMEAQDGMQALIACADLTLRFSKPAMDAMVGLLKQIQEDTGQNDMVCSKLLENIMNSVGMVAQNIDALQLSFAVLSRILPPEAHTTPTQVTAPPIQPEPEPEPEPAPAPTPAPPPEPGWAPIDGEHVINLPPDMPGPRS